MWPEFFIEALEGRLNGCTGGDERYRCALLSSLLVVGQRGLAKLALAVSDVGVGYGAVLCLGNGVHLAATIICEYALDTRFSLRCAEHAHHVILDEAVVSVRFQEESRAKRMSLTFKKFQVNLTAQFGAIKL